MSSISNKRLATLSVAALGVVYGDIGTSPLYALRESLRGLPITTVNVFGILSLIFWSLILIISVKYIGLILRADNDGEGGVLALLALLKRLGGAPPKLLFLIGIFAAGLLLGDGMLTPAISVMSAIEGLNIISPEFSHYVLPLTVIILVILFFLQQHGTEKIGRLFGPIILFWFLTLATLGAYRVSEQPQVLNALNPYYAFNFFLHNGWMGYILLGGVFLVVTGGEALYADLGHFGKRPIRIGWFGIALPALLLNYFGQGAYLLQYPAAIVNPFYSIAPGWFSFPLLILATVATIIASQAVISATFSLTKQAVLLELYPKIPIIQTSEKEKGQIYVPQMNVVLGIGTLILVIIFKNSSNLTHAYGIAVNLDMLVVTILVTYLAHQYWRWPKLGIIAVFSVFLIIEFAFLGANIQKIMSGGWIPLLFALVCVCIMITWQQGMNFLRSSYYMEKIDLKDLIDQLDHSSLNFLPNSTAVFITDPYDKSGGSLLHYLKLNRILPERVLILSTTVGTHPFIENDARYKLTQFSPAIFRLVIHYGFMDTVNIPEALEIANQQKIFPFHLEVNETTFLIEIPSVIATKRQRTLLFFWQEKLFAFLMRNAALDIEFFQLPYNRTIAIGTYCEI